MIDGVADLVRQLLHLEPLIREVGPQVGYTVLFVIVFVETALFIGFFLPGDSLLLTAGLLASQRFFAIELLIPLLCVAAIAGDATGTPTPPDDAQCSTTSRPASRRRSPSVKACNCAPSL